MPKKLIVHVSVLFFLPLFLCFSQDQLKSFGKGEIRIRLYTDYFCGPCSSIEEQIEPILKELVKKNLINLTFIDVPIHQFTPLYASYFLYILKENKEFEDVLRGRLLLFRAAKEKIVNKEALERFLEREGVKFSPVDVKGYFNLYNLFLKEDNITATPTCVILTEKNKETFVGTKDILNILKSLNSKGP